MAENITRLDYDGREIILIGTAHVSQASVDLVRETIAAEQPDSVCIELDESRYKTIKDPRAWEKTDLARVVREKKAGLMLIQLALSSYQKRMAKKLGVEVGGEMRQAITSAEEIGAKIVLADRNIQTTFLRVWRLLGVKERAKLIFGLAFGEQEDEPTEEDIAELLQKDMLQSILAEVNDEFPVIGQVLIHERDQFLANQIKQAQGQKIVAVLGGAHVPGVQEEIYKEQDMEKISIVPQKKSRAKYIAWVLPIAFIALLIYSFTQNVDLGMQNLWTWLFWNGLFAAAFALICLAHPASILVALLASPLTTLSPFLAAGWFAGLTEAWVRKPRVEDLQSMPEDLFHIRKFFRNRALKVLIVTIMVNIGSTIGAIVAGADILSNIFG